MCDCDIELPKDAVMVGECNYKCPKCGEKISNVLLYNIIKLKEEKEDTKPYEKD